MLGRGGLRFGGLLCLGSVVLVCTVVVWCQLGFMFVLARALVRQMAQHFIPLMRN